MSRIAIPAFAILFLIAWNYVKIHRGIIDPLPDSLPCDSPRWAPLWAVKDFLTYAVLFWLLAEKAAKIPFSRTWDKFLITGLAASVAFGVIALIIDGNIDTGELWDWLPVWASVLGYLYAAGVWLRMWRRRAPERIVLPGGVYLVERYPRTVWEWLAIVIRWPGYRGPVAIICNGHWYGADRQSGKFARVPIQYEHRPDQVLTLCNLTPAHLERAWRKLEGTRWTPWKNCFWAVSKALQK